MALGSLLSCHTYSVCVCVCVCVRVLYNNAWTTYKGDKTRIMEAEMKFIRKARLH
jgi:hypothetical protein